MFLSLCPHLKTHYYLSHPPLCHSLQNWQWPSHYQMPLWIKASFFTPKTSHSLGFCNFRLLWGFFQHLCLKASRVSKIPLTMYCSHWVIFLSHSFTARAGTPHICWRLPHANLRPRALCWASDLQAIPYSMSPGKYFKLRQKPNSLPPHLSLTAQFPSCSLSQEWQRNWKTKYYLFLTFILPHLSFNQSVKFYFTHTSKNHLHLLISTATQSRLWCTLSKSQICSWYSSN